MSNSRVTNFNKVSRFIIVIIAVVFSSFVTSCSKDDGESVNPEERLPFVGTYQVKDHNQEEGDTYFNHKLYVTVSDKGANVISLKNFRYINNGVVATVKGSKFTIKQTMQDSNEKVEINGEGTLSGGNLNYSYTIFVKKTGKPDRTFVNTAEATRIQEQ
jgi:hypothetical protein